MVQHITDFSDIKIFVTKMYFEEGTFSEIIMGSSNQNYIKPRCYHRTTVLIHILTLYYD